MFNAQTSGYVTTKKIKKNWSYAIKLEPLPIVSTKYRLLRAPKVIIVIYGHNMVRGRESI